MTGPRSAASTSRRRALWIFLACFLVAAASSANALGACLLFLHGDLTGLVCVGVLLTQPTLYKAMTYGL